MGGVIVKQALPTEKVRQVDPFLLLHHARFGFTDLAPAIKQGLGPHPHRGFTPVSFVIEGEIHHRDSRGHSQIAKAGEVQWMHAGAGIIHSERPSHALAERKGYQELIQLWINSPADKKMQQPSYQYIPETQMPSFLSDDTLVKTKIVAGNYANQRGQIRTESDLLILWSYAQATGVQQFEIPHNFNSTLYLIKGTIQVKGFGLVEPKSLVVFEEADELIEIKANEEAQFLILAGAPLNEKVVQQGPFVMNTETQILEAMRDYRMGKMGILIEE